MNNTNKYLVFLGVVATIIILLIASIIIISKSSISSDPLNFIYTGNSNSTYDVGTVLESDTTSARVIGTIEDPKEENGEIFVTFSVPGLNQKILVSTGTDEIAINYQNTPYVFPTSDHYRSALVPRKDIKKVLSELKNKKIIITFFTNDDKGQIAINRNTLSCNARLVATIRDKGFKKIDCTPYAYEITAYVEKL